MKRIEATLTGDSPLIMHNGQLVDPRNEFTKELKRLTGLRKKTEEQQEEIRKVEWFGGLYRDEKGAIAIPADLVLACLNAGARKSRNGKLITAGVVEGASYFPLVYEGPKEPSKLYDAEKFCDYRSVVIGRNRVMRARPRFDHWSLPISLLVNEEIVECDTVISALEAAGEYCGIGDFRPRYGRFSVTT